MVKILGYLSKNNQTLVEMIMIRSCTEGTRYNAPRAPPEVNVLARPRGGAKVIAVF